MKNFLLLFSFIVTGIYCRAQTAELPKLVLEDFAGGFELPIDIQNAGDSWLYIVEQVGKIKIVTEDGFTLAQPFLDISDKILLGKEQGLLGLAFHPNYEVNGYFYVNYVNKGANTVISRFTRSSSNPKLADPNSELMLLKVEHPFVNHYGGGIRFGPDGYLYSAIGDGGGQGDPLNNAQDPSTLLGKMMRINVDGALPYSIPPTNPYVGVAGYRPEIWALGFRNPFRWSFDRLTGDLWIGDVGQYLWEEIDFQKASSPGGENYGWDCREGDHFYEPGNCEPSDELKDPIYEYMHDGADCSVQGGFVYRGSIYPNMYGKYIFVDYCSGRFRTLFKYGGEDIAAIIAVEAPFSYVTFGEDKQGELYVANNVEGSIYHVTDASEVLKEASATLFENDDVKLYPNPNSGEFTIEWIASANEASTIEINNLLGQRIISESITSTEGVNTWTSTNTQLTKGSYILVINTNAGSMRKTFIVE